MGMPREGDAQGEGCPVIGMLREGDARGGGCPGRGMLREGDALGWGCSGIGMLRDRDAWGGGCSGMEAAQGWGLPLLGSCGGHSPVQHDSVGEGADEQVRVEVPIHVQPPRE